MNRLNLTVCALSALALAACSQAADTPAQAPAEPAPVPAEAPAAKTDVAYTLDAASEAFIASLSPKELGAARLSCVRPLDSAKAATNLFDEEMAAQLKAAPSMSQTKLLTSIEGMTMAEGRQILDLGPRFTPGGEKPSEDDIKGLKQCIGIAHHYARTAEG